MAITDVNDAIHAAREEGFNTYKNLDLDEAEKLVKANPGVVGGMHIINLGTAPRYLKMYNASGTGDVTVGTTEPKEDLTVPTLGDTNGAGYLVSPNADGAIRFGTGIVVAATTGYGSADSGAPGANEVLAHIWYR
jgi:hypothetical protein